MPLYGQNVCRSTGASASAATSSRGTYQRGAKPGLVQHDGGGGVGDDAVRRRGRRGAATCGGCRCGGRGRRRGRGCGRPPRRSRPSPRHASATMPSRIAAWSGSATCCQAPRAAWRVPPTTSNQAVSPSSGCSVRWSVGLSAPPRSRRSGSTRPGNGPARTAGRRRRSGPPYARRARRASGAAAALRRARAPACPAPGTARWGFDPEALAAMRDPSVALQSWSKAVMSVGHAARRSSYAIGAITIRS